MRPILDDEEAIKMGLDPIEDEALAVNGKTREELAKAPSERTVWKKFTNFVNKISEKAEFYVNKINFNKENLCGNKEFELANHQRLLKNFVNNNTPYKDAVLSLYNFLIV